MKGVENNLFGENKRVFDKTLHGVYFFGGRNQYGEATNGLYVLCPGPRPLKWKKIRPDGKEPSPRYFHSAHIVNS